MTTTDNILKICDIYLKQDLRHELKKMNESLNDPLDDENLKEIVNLTDSLPLNTSLDSMNLNGWQLERLAASEFEAPDEASIEDTIAKEISDLHYINGKIQNILALKEEYNINRNQLMKKMEEKKEQMIQEVDNIKKISELSSLPSSIHEEESIIVPVQLKDRMLASMKQS